MAEPNAYLDLTGSPSLTSVGTKNLVVGTNGAADFVVVTGGTERLRISSTGVTTLTSAIDLTLANNDYFLSKDAAGTGSVRLIKADASDNTVVNAETGKLFSVAFNNTATHAFNSLGLILGGLANITGITAAPLTVVASGDTNNGIILHSYSTTAGNAASFVFSRTKGAAADTNAIVTTNDAIGIISALGADGGTAYDGCAQIIFKADGTWAASGDSPGRIEFWTVPDSSGTAAEAVRIDSAKNLKLAGRLIETLGITDVDAQNNTLSAAQIAGGVVIHTSVTGAGTITLDTAANIIAGSNNVGTLTTDGQCIKCYYINDGSQTLTFGGAPAGVTYADTGQTIAADESAMVLIRRTGASTVTVYCIGA